MDNLGYITQDDSAEFTIAKRKYIENSLRGPAFITGLCTFSAFSVGLWILPSRISTFKYTMTGFTAGAVLSYAFWRYSMNSYYKIMNKHFRSIVKEKYLEEKNSSIQ